LARATLAKPTRVGHSLALAAWAPQAELLQLSCADAPAHFLVAMSPPAGGGPALLGAGRGLSREQALASCVGEVAERGAARRPGVPVVVGRAGDLPGRAVAANRLWCFSRRQLARGPHPSEDCAPATWAAARRTIRDCRRWCRARDGDGGAGAFLPAAAVLPGEGGLAGSNGLAAGADRAAAERAAVLELVERDAVAIWWYGRIARPGIALALLDDAGGGALRRWLEARRRRTWLLDLTHDLGIPVVAALSAAPEGSGIAYGFAAGAGLAAAALAATLELLQSEISLDLAARRAARLGRAEGPAGRLLLWSRRAALGRLPFLVPSGGERPAPRRDGDPAALVAGRLGAPPLFVDLDRPGDPFPVVRAFAPGLRPWRPRFARGRLAAVPRRLGWPAAPVDDCTVGEDVILI
jgi:ribosomal protein S12 methylthiotransferase accessory factor